MLWHGKSTVVANGCQKRKKLIRGMEGKIVVLMATCLPQLPVHLKQYNGNFLYTSPFCFLLQTPNIFKIFFAYNTFLTVLLKYL